MGHGEGGHETDTAGNILASIHRCKVRRYIVFLCISIEGRVPIDPKGVQMDEGSTLGEAGWIPIYGKGPVIGGSGLKPIKATDKKWVCHGGPCRQAHR